MVVIEKSNDLFKNMRITSKNILVNYYYKHSKLKFDRYKLSFYKKKALCMTFYRIKHNNTLSHT